MRKTIALLAGVVLLLLANYTIYSKEKLLSEGQVVLLELAPVDPRSLMQGDYMALRFRVADEAFGRGAVPGSLGDAQHESLRDGHVVLALDENRVGRFVRLDNASPLAVDEVRMRYRVRGGEVKFATNAFLFQEGTGERYAKARFGEFRVDANGDAILTNLRD